MIDFGDKVYVNYRGEKVIDFSYGDKLELKKGMFDNHTDVQILMMNIDSVFPEGIFDNLVNLKNLDLSRCKNISLHKGIFDKLVNLKILDLSKNNLVSLPEGIFDNLVKLEALFLSKNNLVSLPEGIFDNLMKLEALYINNNKIVSFSNNLFRNLVNLRELYISNNYFRSLPKGIFDKLENLERLYIPYNNLVSLPHNTFHKLVNLKELSLNNNELVSLPNEIFGNNTKLIYIGFSYNTLTAIPFINHLIELKYLFLQTNHLTSLPLVDNLVNLARFNISRNNLNFIPDDYFNTLTRLTCLDISINNFVTLPLSLRNCINVTDLRVDNNPIEYIPPQLQRFLERNKNRAIQSISKDNQNVHNSAIQRSLNTSISNLLKEKPALTTEEVVTFITNSEFITPEAKSYLLTYSEDETVHSVHDVTFSEVLTSVISEIISLKEKDEVLKILSEEISDSICKCFTGRISRLVNSLNGFSTKVKVEISKNTQISTILAQTAERISKVNTEEEVTKIKEETIINLREHEFTEEEIEDWMSYS